MAGKRKQFADALERIGRAVIAELAGLPDAALNRILPIPDTNTLFATATHLVGAGEFWVLALAGGREMTRDRLAEFHAAGQGPELIARYEGWIAAVHEVLATLPDAAMANLSDPPVAFRNTGGLADRQLTVRDCLLHAVEHSTLHLEHIQITRQIVLALPDAGC